MRVMLNHLNEHFVKYISSLFSANTEKGETVTKFSLLKVHQLNQNSVFVYSMKFFFVKTTHWGSTASHVLSLSNQTPQSVCICQGDKLANNLQLNHNTLF